MFIVENYAMAVVLCFITMMCWGSWGNTQKLAAKTWRYELFYWDYVMVENSEGAHNYKAAHANLDKAEAQLEEGFALLGIA